MKKQEERNAANKILCLVMIVAACFVHGVMQGIHDNYGIMMNGLIGVSGISYASISFCIGAGALVYGFAQPFLGMLALKKSNAYVIMLGIFFTVLGLIVTPFCRNAVTMFLFFGLILPFGTTGLCFGIIMGAITPVLGERKAAMVSGIVQASAGIGDALMSPMLQSMSAAFGIRIAMQVLAIPFLVMIPVACWMGKVNRAVKKETEVSPEEGKTESLVRLITDALKHHNYRMILLGFATCGFNMSIIESHLFSQFISYGIDASVASLTLTAYGIATMIGAVLSGFLGTKYKMKNVLSFIYAVRVVISLGFLLLPKTAGFAFAATALLGMSGDATVPPTSGLVSKEFGPEKMAVLYGTALVGHQIGAFLSSLLGGIFADNGLGYNPLWTLNMCLAAFAAAVSFAIREEKS